MSAMQQSTDPLDQTGGPEPIAEPEANENPFTSFYGQLLHQGNMLADYVRTGTYQVSRAIFLDDILSLLIYFYFFFYVRIHPFHCCCVNFVNQV